MKFTYAPGATPIDASAMHALIPKLSLQSELDAAELANIVDARVWLSERARTNTLTADFVRLTHKKMFNRVWRWAGEFRQHETRPIGAPWATIPVALKQLLDDARYWCEHATYPWDELGARFHRGLVFIHCFANGNGRHARLMTDLLLRQHGQEEFSWGERGDAAALRATSSTRQRYLEALRAADGERYEPLLQFVRS